MSIKKEIKQKKSAAPDWSVHDHIRQIRKGQDNLYVPQTEHDACGVGLIAHLRGEKSHELVEQGLKILENLTHRGAVGCDPDTGDGAGILLQMPDAFLRSALKPVGIDLPPEGKYGVASIFMPTHEKEYESIRRVIERVIEDEGLHILYWREVPVRPDEIGRLARDLQPEIIQVFISGDYMEKVSFDRRLYVTRKLIERGVARLDLKNAHMFYIASMSCRTLVYKGLLLADQVPEFYVDLKSPKMGSGLALVHQRYSTNTMPTWDLAHPFRIIAHNGEINTLRGNVNWMRAREMVLQSNLFSAADLKKLTPIINEFGSDSACFDNCLELLVQAGRELPEAIMMMVPEAWEKQPDMDPVRRAFYEYHANKMEAWDGPAAIAYTDGRVIGATLDRNGLRPARYMVTDDDLVVMASESGVLPIPEDKIIHKGRIHPGRMFLIDTAQGRILRDGEIKSRIANAKPYKKWIDDNEIRIDDLPSVEPQTLLEGENLKFMQRSFGYTREDLEEILVPMAVHGKEPTNSMGNDAALAVLSNQSRNFYDYFKQLFAQVTNPAIDPIREALVMSLISLVGPMGNLLEDDADHCRRLELDQPVLMENELESLVQINRANLRGRRISTLFDALAGPDAMGRALHRLCRTAESAVKEGTTVLVLSDRRADEESVAIPALLACSAVHHHLIRSGLRTRTGLVVEGGDVREVAHFALLIGYGADAICPYLALASLDEQIKEGFAGGGVTTAQGRAAYVKAIGAGLLKVFSKIGVATLQSYKGAQIFEAIGLHGKLINKHFTGTASRINGADLTDIGREVLRRHQKALKGEEGRAALPAGGQNKYRTNGEFHQWNPESIALFQDSVRSGDYTKFQEFSRVVNDQSKALATIRGLICFRKTQPVSIEDVEPESAIVKRFATGAMSFGSISREAHETIAIAMNRLQGKSNTGEGGEDPARFKVDANGDLRRSAIKQVASGRFGVTTEYLVNADELQIKIAQGAKPGEGGQLPGHKVSEEIAAVRHTVPGVTLISPPPHHDIYSIEDLAQLIFDLKNVNPEADISVKLVAEVGVGTVAAGVAKGHADMVLIAGHDGGTGASPISSIKHAGLPWEIGLAETQQVLVQNDLRGRIRVQTDGQLKTGRDVAIAALLGAEEFGFATSALIAEGCIMMRKCHLNTCPVGVATQNPELRKRFKGKPEHIVNFLTFVARELREIMAELGFKTVQEMVGRSDVLDYHKADDHWKAHGLSLGKVLAPPVAPPSFARRCESTQDHGIKHIMDRKLIEKCRPAIDGGRQVSFSKDIRNLNRSTGAMLSGEIAKKYGFAGLPDDTIKIHFRGTAGQSFGAFLTKGIQFDLEGDANDYLGKGLCGGRIIVRPAEESSFVAEDNIIVGNTLFYGGITGESFIRGRSGERFAVRNSGVTAVVEGVGDHGCEYMTGGTVVVLGETGRNFAAGMSGGIAFVLDEKGGFTQKCNRSMVELERVVTDEDKELLQTLIQRHKDFTGSAVAERLLADWPKSLAFFHKVMPQEYKRVLMLKKSKDGREVSNG